MGHYTGVKIQFTLTPEVPEEAIFFLESFLVEYAPEPDEAIQRHALGEAWYAKVVPDFTEKHQDALLSHVLCESAYFDGWKQRMLVERAAENGHEFISYASTKHADMACIKAFLTAFQPWLDNKHGDILAKLVHEDGMAEDVLWFDKENQKLQEEEGALFEYEQGFVTDATHPKFIDEGHPFHELDQTPTTIVETRLQRAKFEEDRRKNYSGFGF